jgi:hypothetical protein
MNGWKCEDEKGTFPMIDGVMDMLGAFYYARRLDVRSMPDGTVVPIPVFLDDKIYDLGMKILGREKIKTDLGTFRCIKITPLVVADRVFRGGAEMIMWVTDDENLIPVKITSPVIVGSVSATLVRYENLKYPLSSASSDISAPSGSPAWQIPLFLTWITVRVCDMLLPSTDPYQPPAHPLVGGGAQSYYHSLQSLSQTF